MADFTLGNPSLDYFQVGRNLGTGQNALASLVNGVMQRANQHFQLQQQMNMQLAMAPELKYRETLAGYRALASPEVQALRSKLPQLGDPTGSNTRTPSMGGGQYSSTTGYTPEYGLTKQIIDPFDPMATKYEYSETPESQMQRTQATKSGEETRTALSGFGKPMIPANLPFLGQISASPKAQAIINGMPNLTTNDIPSLQNAVANGVFSREDLPALAQAFQKKFPLAQNPFSQPNQGLMGNQRSGGNDPQLEELQRMHPGAKITRTS